MKNTWKGIFTFISVSKCNFFYKNQILGDIYGRIKINLQYLFFGYLQTKFSMHIWRKN
jgi:hypothetical protein